MTSNHREKSGTSLDSPTSQCKKGSQNRALTSLRRDLSQTQKYIKTIMPHKSIKVIGHINGLKDKIT